MEAFKFLPLPESDAKSRWIRPVSRVSITREQNTMDTCVALDSGMSSHLIFAYYFRGK